MKQLFDRPVRDTDQSAAAAVIVALLERKLAEAKAGTLVGVGVVSVYGPNDIKVDTHGTGGSDVVTGAEQMKKQVLEQMFAPALPGGMRPS
jgi:hypothetical protein